MYERFTDRARKVLQLANQEAQRFNHEYIAPEHVLIGLAKEGSGVAAAILKDADISLRKIRLEVEKLVQSGPEMITMGKLPQTPNAKKVIEYSMEEARNLNHAFVGTEHILLALIRVEDSVAHQVLTGFSLTLDELRESVMSYTGPRADDEGAESQPRPRKSKTPALDAFTCDITELAKNQKLRPVIGRFAEIERLTTVLSKLDRHNAMLIGDTGSGRHSIVHGLAHRIANETVRVSFANFRIVELDQGMLVAGTKYRGQFEERVKAIVNEIRRAKNVILFVPQIHTLSHLGIHDELESELSGFELLKFAMAKNEIKCIGTCTPREFKDRISIDSDFQRCFQLINVDPPSQPEAIEILQGIKTHFEKHHGANITDEAIVAAVELSELYMPDLPLPDKAINLIDEAGAQLGSLEVKETVQRSVSPQEIVRLVSLEAGIPEADVAGRRNVPGSEQE